VSALTGFTRNKPRYIVVSSSVSPTYYGCTFVTLLKAMRFFLLHEEVESTTRLFYITLVDPPTEMIGDRSFYSPACQCLSGRLSSPFRVPPRSTFFFSIIHMRSPFPPPPGFSPSDPKIRCFDPAFSRDGPCESGVRLQRTRTVWSFFHNGPPSYR